MDYFGNSRNDGALSRLVQSHKAITHRELEPVRQRRMRRGMAGDRFDVESAGTEKTRVHPRAMEAMREIGIDISRHSSKTLDALEGEHFGYVITVCDRANDSCPVFPGGTIRLHWSFDDPRASTGSDEERLGAFRRIRDAIAERIGAFVESGR